MPDDTKAMTTAEAESLVVRIRADHRCDQCDGGLDCDAWKLAAAVESLAAQLDALRAQLPTAADGSGAVVPEAAEAFATIQALQQQVAQMEASVAEACGVILRSNRLLRSCHEVATRELTANASGTTNWEGLRKQLSEELHAQHELTTIIRARLAEAAGR